MLYLITCESPNIKIDCVSKMGDFEIEVFIEREQAGFSLVREFDIGDEINCDSRMHMLDSCSRFGNLFGQISSRSGPSSSKIIRWHMLTHPSAYPDKFLPRKLSSKVKQNFFSAHADRSDANCFSLSQLAWVRRRCSLIGREKSCVHAPERGESRTVLDSFTLPTLLLALFAFVTLDALCPDFACSPRGFLPAHRER